MNSVGTTSDQNPYLTGGDASAQEWTNVAHRLQQEGTITAEIIMANGVATEKVSGPCPRCGTVFTWTRVVSGPVLKGRSSLTAGTWETVLVACSCSEEHLGHPNGAVGCGIRYNVSAMVEVRS